MNKIGVMQGRLLPKYLGRYQAHPINYWKDEFFIANEIGLDCIEFILDYNDADRNPLLRDDGIKEIESAVQDSLIEVKTICADYFMEAPLHSYDSSVVKTSQNVMKKLLDNAKKIGVSDIVIPCVDQSSLEGKDAAKRFVRNLKPMLKIAEKYGINLSLETDLPPGPFVDLLDRFDSHRVKVNYDIGNSASLGYNPIEELDAYGDKISDIHIKDRVLGGGPVVLGSGDADFNSFFKGLTKVDYHGPFIMQAYRDDEGVSIFKSQLNWVKKYIS
jgi:L-ribulose-5-phosphate 3-epimerase